MRCLTTLTADLGESPRWDPARGWIWFVDLTRGVLHAVDRRGEPVHRAAFAEELCSVALAGDGSLALLLRSGLHRYEPETGTTVLVARAPYDPATHLFNDCGVDPTGTLWVGVAAADETPGAGALLRWSPRDGFETVQDGMTLPNGIGWSPSGRWRFVVDSLEHEVTVHAPGAGSSRWCVPSDAGLADGLAVDADGDVWIGYWGGGCVRRHHRDGTVREEYRLPVGLATAPLLVPGSAPTLVVTTARATLSAPDLDRQPTAGRLHACAVTARPQPPTALRWSGRR